MLLLEGTFLFGAICVCVLSFVIAFENEEAVIMKYCLYIYIYMDQKWHFKKEDV